ncbi:MAG: hypothetical protein ACJ74Z_10965 [Bryobacteraceae bacterium]
MTFRDDERRAVEDRAKSGVPLKQLRLFSDWQEIVSMRFVNGQIYLVLHNRPTPPGVLDALERFSAGWPLAL